MNKVEKFYKDTYGEDAPKEFNSMKAKTLFEFAEAYAQEQVNDNIPLVSKSLLEKYIEHVRQYEGTTFVNKCNDGYSSDVKFSDEEIKILKRLS